MTTERTPDRYFVTDADGVERETDAEGFIELKRRCGFRPKEGCGPFATGGFSSGSRSGRIESWFDGPAAVIDGETGESTPAGGCREAYDLARERNDRAPRRRHFVMSAKAA